MEYISSDTNKEPTHGLLVLRAFAYLQAAASMYDFSMEVFSALL